MNAADLLVKSLENEGVKYAFGLPGEELRDFLFALEKSPIKMVVARHEQGAAFMADVYGRVSGKAGVCFSTLGPGATNLVTGVADANLDHAPLVAITAQGSMERLHKESHQIVDIVNLFKPITKWNTRISSPRIVTEIVRKAFKVAEMEKPGATHLELPEDIARMETKGKPLKREHVRRSSPDHKALKAAADLLKKSKRPLILAGNGAVRKLSSKQLCQLVEQTGIPVLSTYMGKGAISDQSKESLMSLGLGTRSSVQKVLSAADLVITIGYDISELDPVTWNKNGKKILHIDFTPAEVYEYYQPDVELVADISNTLWFLNQAIDKKYTFPEAAVYRKEIEKTRLAYKNEQFPLHPRHALQQLRGVMDDHAILISDVGAHKMWIGATFPTYERGTVIISNGFASMGVAVPGAIGAKLAAPDKDVIAVTGDGGFVMNMQELQTARDLNLDLTVIIFNDQTYSLIEAKFLHEKKKTVGTGLTNPDFKKIAEGFGCKYYYVDSAKEARNVYEEARKARGVRIIEVPIDSKANEGLFK